MKMTVEEALIPERRDVDNEHIYIIKVMNQKNLKCGKEAIAYSKKCYDVLLRYINELRPVRSQRLQQI